MIFGLSGSMSENNSSELTHKITAEEAKIKMDSDDIIILDVRTQEEYNSGQVMHSDRGIQV